MGSFHKAPSPPMDEETFFFSDVPVVFLSPDAAWVARLVADGMTAVAWCGDPEQWPAVAQALKSTHVIIQPCWCTGQWVKAPIPTPGCSSRRGCPRTSTPRRGPRPAWRSFRAWRPR
jgi:hypothetical protein